MIGAMIWVLAAGCMLLMGIAYTAVMAYCIGRRIVKRWRRRRYEPTEAVDKVEGEE